jgi:predicted amidohydrolase YtcJ
MARAAKKKVAKTARKVEAPDNADLIFHGGKVYTVDGKRRWAEAVAVKRGKIVAVGSEHNCTTCKAA